VASLEDRETAQATQKQFPQLTVVADAEGGLGEALQVLHPGAGPGGRDTFAPTTVLVDGKGVVRWVYRPDRHIVRLAPAQLLAALDEHLPPE
jgi:peroxiredoxin